MPSPLSRSRKASDVTLLRRFWPLVALILVFSSYTVLNAIHRKRADGWKGANGANEDSPKHPLWIRQSLAYIPDAVVSVWEQRQFLVVLGIPSIDLEVRRRRRELQRTTCWLYNGVAQHSNDFVGDMLPLYVLGKHPDNGYMYTRSLAKEAGSWQDILSLPMFEGRVSTKKRVGQGGKWGIKAEVGMSRKTFMWFDISLQLFPKVVYFGKGDDDMFLRVPQYLADLRAMPRRGLYWGTMGWFTVHGIQFNYAFGACYVLGRDVAEHFVSYVPLREIIHAPYSAERDEKFRSLYLMAEDAMVGLTLRKAMYHTSIVYVNEQKCSYHDVHAGPTRKQVTESSIMVHHVREEDYGRLKRLFSDEENVRPRLLEGVPGVVRNISCL